jgi:putative two-component system response regulator
MKILIADDSPFYRTALRVALTGWGYVVIEAADGTAAWEILQRETAPKLAILDWMMPGMDGPEVCRRLRATPRHEPTYVIMLTSRNGTANVVAALDSGADDYVAKPFDRDELLARLRVGRRIVGLQTSEVVVFSFARAVDAKNPYTKGHSDRVMRYAVALADRVGLPAAEREVLRRGAILHDIGKICIPDSILDKPGPLTPAEFAVVRQHPVRGVAMVEPLESVRDVIPIIRWHHERVDGGGYPDGLAGGDIPLLARITAVADVYDALSSDRPYRAGLPAEQCLSILAADAAGGGLDPDLVAAFRDLRPQAIPHPSSGLVATPAPRAALGAATAVW